MAAPHLGVLPVLARERIPVHVIAATSMGAVVGGLYATGRSANQIATMVAGIDWADALRDEPPLGPVFIGLWRSERGMDSFYLHVGSLLRPSAP